MRGPPAPARPRRRGAGAGAPPPSPAAPRPAPAGGPVARSANPHAKLQQKRRQIQSAPGAATRGRQIRRISFRRPFSLSRSARPPIRHTTGDAHGAGSRVFPFSFAFFISYMAHLVLEHVHVDLLRRRVAVPAGGAVGGAGGPRAARATAEGGGQFAHAGLRGDLGLGALAVVRRLDQEKCGCGEGRAIRWPSPRHTGWRSRPTWLSPRPAAAAGLGLQSRPAAPRITGESSRRRQKRPLQMLQTTRSETLFGLTG